MTGPYSGPAPNGSEGPRTDPLAGLTVIDLSTSTQGLTVTQFLADAGAEVIGVEPPGGNPIRRQPGWPALARGRRSVVLDLAEPGDRARLDVLLADADVLVTTQPRAVSETLGLTAEVLGARFPRLVSAELTAWGTTGPWAHLKPYEGLVMAKMGLFQSKNRSITRPGPAFISVPYASWGAAQAALHGILSALIERETSGRGQHVEADMVRGVTLLDTWTWYTEMVGIRWPDAYSVVDAYDDNGEPLAALVYPLLNAPTKDGTWLQFAQVEPRLFAGMMEELGLTHLFTDPKWAGLPALPTQELRTELWELMISRVRERTLAEWEEVFRTNKNISAEPYRAGADVFAHPQLVHDGRVVTVDDPDLGPVTQPSTLVHSDEQPLSLPRPAPRLDADGEALRSRPAPERRAPAATDAGGGLPLAGLTILDFGLMFAGPFGATVLTDLGARVIKIETVEGDTIRRLFPFPEAAGMKVMQGKESISVDVRTEEGRAIVHELARRADVVLQSFRAGAAARAGIDADTLKAINPNLVYVNAPGYGTDGPYSSRPAYAPSIGAAMGFALTDAPDAASATETMDQIKAAAVRLNSAAAIPSIQADGVAALGVASAMLLGVLAQRRGRPLGNLTATMIGSATHALVHQLVDYPGRPPAPTVDLGGHGFAALYRMYRAAEGWVFLAALAPEEWDELVAALPAGAGLDDPRFATAESRTENDTALAEVLGGVFAGRAASDWERDLTAAGVGLVQVHEGLPEVHLQTDKELADEYCTTSVSPIFEEHLRMQPAMRFSRSATRALGGVLAGQHTDAILTELGYDADRIADLRERNIVAG